MLLIFFIYLNVKYILSQSIIINGDNQIINTLSLEVNGTHDGSITLPLWFEIYNGQNLQDYGAFEAKNPWRFEARHLNIGDNFVNVYGIDGTGNTVNSTVIYTININNYVNPRPRPAEIIWGKLYSDALLTLSNQNSWQYVQKYQDGYFIHSTGFDLGGNPEIVLNNLYNILGSGLNRWIVELGGTTQPNSTWPNQQIAQWGGWTNRISSLGIVFSILCHDWEQNIEAFVQEFPYYDNTEIINLQISLWNNVFQQYKNLFPWSKISQTSSPVWWQWSNFTGLGYRNDMQFGNIDIDMQPLMNGMSQSMKSAGYPIYHFGSDVPEYSLNWDIQQEKIMYQEKILAYEQNLISQNNKHMLLCMGPNNYPSNSIEWDTEYSSQSLQELYLYQSIGGRADVYNFESFYDQGPLNIVPEDVNNTYTNTVKSALQYIKGIKDVSGNLETLSLTNIDNSIILTNTGLTICMPSIIAINNNGLIWTFNNTDITHQITHPDGYVVTNMLRPGDQFTLQFINSNHYRVVIQAFWNPQDPSGIIRDTIIISN